MRLTNITFTGIDAHTDIKELIEIQREYPIAEFGVLTSINWKENGNRYLDPKLIKTIFRFTTKLNLSLHICGGLAHAAAEGYWSVIDEHLLWEVENFNRIQLNISNHKNNPEHLWPTCFPNQELIVQQRDANNLTLFDRTLMYWSNRGKSFSVLLDASGGQGINTPLKVLPSRCKVGYAGGINPENVGKKLAFLLRNVHIGEFWIDMESGVRTDDWFDTTKVRRVLEICDKVAKNFGINIKNSEE